MTSEATFECGFGITGTYNCDPQYGVQHVRMHAKINMQFAEGLYSWGQVQMTEYMSNMGDLPDVQVVNAM